MSSSPLWRPCLKQNKIAFIYADRADQAHGQDRVQGEQDTLGSQAGKKQGGTVTKTQTELLLERVPPRKGLPWKGTVSLALPRSVDAEQKDRFTMEEREPESREGNV